ncbi:hypothetical protein GC173_13725 [bacterium]|nr:hypothetical protein [bacterium]
MLTMRPWALGLTMAVALLGSGCQSARVGVGQPRALIYNNVTVPFTLKRNRGPMEGEPIRIPSNAVSGKSRFYYIGIPLFGAGIPTPGLTPVSVGWGDGSLETAMADGKIKEVIYGDAQHIEVLGVFNKVVMTVYGEPAE